MKKVPITANLGALLKYVGTQYRSHADALKEHISNAIDEHLRAQREGRAQPVCKVVFQMARDKIIIEYPYGMSKEEFKDALQRVADSMKKRLKEEEGFVQIGQLGVGIFSFQKSARKCTFVSRKDKEIRPIKVVLKEGKDKAEFQTPKKAEIPKTSGIRIILSELKINPIRARGPLSPEKLQRTFAERFDSYLRAGTLEIEIRYPKKVYQVQPLEIDLPVVGQDYQELYVKGDPNKKIHLELYFDPSGKGKVAIRHTGVAVVEDISNLEAYGLEESIFASGELKGFIDADFLTPLASRDGFEENDNWLFFLEKLITIVSSIEAEVEMLKEEQARKNLTEIQRRAIELAREILNSERFRDLELIEELGRKSPEPRLPPNGFDFVPNSIRIDPGKSGKLPLKVLVPKIVPDKTKVRFSIDNSSINVKPKTAVLCASEADKNGVVVVPVKIISCTQNPIKKATLTAVVGKMNLKAEASVRVYSPVQTRKTIMGEKDRKGRGINYEERPFEDGSLKHSRLVSSVIQINTLNPDYKEHMKGSDQEKLMYAALMIGKETIAYNDKNHVSDEFLERLLSFLFELKRRLLK